MATEVKESPVYSVMLDESTDVSVHQNLIVYVRYLTSLAGSVQPVTQFLGIRQLQTANAESIYLELLGLIQSFGFSLDNLIGVSTDGAAVMLGCKSGVVTRLKEATKEIKFINESSSIDVCKGKDVHFIFKVDEEENKIKRLEWYFSNTVICTSYSHDDFTVKPLYQGRIERIGRTGIQLKNVSIDDEGIYMLLPLNPWSATDIRVKIKLRVLEPPTNKCTCNASTSEQTESYCGRPQVSCVWKRKQTFEVLQDGNRIMKSIFEDKELLYCQDGEAMKCVDDKRQFCTTVSLYRKDNDRPSEDGSTQRTDSVTMP
ncbi:hypothetical protein ACJMK2_026324, partial [Sinanodonta woodiana]